jgi:hypothetical protein
MGEMNLKMHVSARDEGALLPLQITRWNVRYAKSSFQNRAVS